MATRLRPIGHEDRLSLIEHLDELRTRLIVSVLAFAAAFAFCAWQNQHILHIVNRPLEHSTKPSPSGKGKGPLQQEARTQAAERKAAQARAALEAELAHAPNLTPRQRRLPPPPPAPHLPPVPVRPSGRWCAGFHTPAPPAGGSRGGATPRRPAGERTAATPCWWHRSWRRSSRRAWTR